MLDPQTLLRLPACIAVFEEVKQERQVLGADDGLRPTLLGSFGGPMATAANRPRGVWNSRKRR